MRKKAVIASFFLFIFFLSTGYAFDNSHPAFQQAVQLYLHENYEEALEAFKGLKASYPKSSEIAFYLGMTHKRMQNYRLALPFLEQAASLKPRYDEAIPELIDLLYQQDMLDKANRWINIAEKGFIVPGQTAFLKGLVLLKQEKIEPAIKAFDDASVLDPSLAQAVAYQKAAALSLKKEYQKAREELRGVVVKDPASDLAAFASEYIDTLRKQQEAERKFKASASFAVQYDDNVTFKPTDESLVSDVSNQGDLVQVGTVQLEWAIKPAKAHNAGLNAVYSFYGTKHNDIGLYDTQSHDISLQPAYYSETAAYALPFHYNYVTLGDDPYLDTVGLSPLVNLFDTYDKMWQFQAQFNHNDYRWAAENEDENRDSQDLVLSVSRYLFLESPDYFNLQYAFNYSDAKGRNWEYAGSRLTMTLVRSLAKTIQWNLVADYFRQDFVNRHSTYDKKRDDDIYTVSNLLVKKLNDNLSLQLQYTWVYDRSNIGIYKYKKNSYSLGAKYRF